MDDDAAVYINPKSNIWHTRDCPHFRPTYRETTVQDAEEWGKRPCVKCILNESYHHREEKKGSVPHDLVDAARQSIEERDPL